MGFCVAAGREELDPCGNLNWSPGGAGTLPALVEEGRRGAAQVVELKKKKRKLDRRLVLFPDMFRCTLKGWFTQKAKMYHYIYEL